MNDERQPAYESRSTPVAGISRRGFLVSTVATGFALAVRPTLSATIVSSELSEGGGGGWMEAPACVVRAAWRC